MRSFLKALLNAVLREFVGVVLELILSIFPPNDLNIPNKIPDEVPIISFSMAEKQSKQICI
ncbi:hypothetical protein HNR00_003393 [Methylorubrum rhodinum]|uniref:Uncharacterized protein n=1 Tax=Methylorubrum rhodinum TaxID=29428 RepID=A0A840ZMW5_9HYPH|nr:hypothetical protein [Methylorubrum rhodinum]MBB5758670.1 hypothetical protein [Methylorubrum rhodinum]